MIFNVEIEKIEVEDRYKSIDFENLKMYHKECYGGEIEVSEINGGHWYKDSKPENCIALICNRCKKRIWILSCVNVNIYKLFVKTAVDGKKREITSNAYGIGDVFTDYNPQKLYNDSAPFEMNNENSLFVSQKGVEEVILEEQELYCPYCGGQLIPEGSYCPFCGIKLDERIEEIKEASVSK
ncbi:MAG: hypothetical protein ACKKMP_00540 [Candidatus Nealsonbacteria bacterium]